MGTATMSQFNSSILMKFIKRVLTFFIVLFCSQIIRAADSSLNFDGESYHEVRSTIENSVEIYDYLRISENIDEWEKMITIQIHPGKGNATEVMNVYAAERQDYYIDEPRIYTSQNTAGQQEMVFEFLLISADLLFAEFSLVRAISKEETSVLLYIFSLKIPNTKDEIDRAVNEIGNQRLEWMNSLMITSENPGAVVL